MSESTRISATYEDILRAPDDVIAEIVEGDLYLSPRPAMRHSQAASALAGKLIPSFAFGGSDAGWWILFEPELHLGGDVLVPDLAGWKRTRMISIPDTAACELAPDWVCEVISPSTANLDRVRKLAAYAVHGVEYVWLVEPKLREVEIYERENDRWILLATHEGDEVIRAVPFVSVEIDLTALWGDAARKQ